MEYLDCIGEENEFTVITEEKSIVSVGITVELAWRNAADRLYKRIVNLKKLVNFDD